MRKKSIQRIMYVVKNKIINFRVFSVITGILNNLEFAKQFGIVTTYIYIIHGKTKIIQISGYLIK